MNKSSWASVFFLFPVLAVVLLSLSCVRQATEKPEETKDIYPRVPGDSTLYALVAAGTNDSILVYLTLPYDGADPDTVNILETMMQRQMFGRPEIGDNVAIMRCDSDSTMADRVIVTEKFVGQWCYEVYPKLRRQIGEGSLPPRLLKLLEEPREYGMVVKPAGVMVTMGAYARQTDEQLPVVYPLAKNYGRWGIFNGRLVLSEMKRDTVISVDTAYFVRLRRDTLILRFNDGERTFYRKTEEE